MIESMIFDWKRTLYDPEERKLTEGAMSVLSKLREKELKLYLVGKDTVGDMPTEVERLDVRRYFNATHFVDNSKNDEDIARFLNLDHPERTIVVGDRVRSEIEIGNRLGALTIQVVQGKFADESPEIDTQEPTYKIKCLSNLMAIICQLENDSI